MHIHTQRAPLYVNITIFFNGKELYFLEHKLLVRRVALSDLAGPLSCAASRKHLDPPISPCFHAAVTAIPSCSRRQRAREGLRAL